MDSTIFTQWFKQKCLPRCRRALKYQGLAERAILLLDNAPSHPDVDSLRSDAGEISCVYLPPNTTSLIQPMDQGVLQNIKRRYKCDLLLRLLDDEADSMNMADFSKTLNIKDAVLMSAKSWDEVEAGTIIKSWSKLLKCQDVHVSDKDFKGAGDDVDVNSLLNDMDVPWTDWLTADEGDPGYRKFSEEEIVSLQGIRIQKILKWKMTRRRSLLQLFHTQRPAKHYRLSSCTLNNNPLHPWVLW